MRKLVAIENVTLDGFADSQEGLGFEWTARAYDEEVDRYSKGRLNASPSIQHRQRHSGTCSPNLSRSSFQRHLA